MKKHPSNKHGAPRQPSDLTLLLSQAEDSKSLGQIITVAYPELRTIARREIYQEALGRTWQPTDLVHEACLRFLSKPQHFKNRAYFFSAATKSMRRLLVDESRKRRSKMRGGDLKRVEFRHVDRLGFDRSHDVLLFDEALKKLQKENPKLGLVAEWRAFSGLSPSKIAAELHLAVATERRHWALARGFLQTVLTGKTPV